jgi:type I restriction enzyme M protein
LTFLLFLKMADEQSKAPFNKRSPNPGDFDWQCLLKRDRDELKTRYRHVLESLGKEQGMRAARVRHERSNSMTS